MAASRDPEQETQVGQAPTPNPRKLRCQMCVVLRCGACGCLLGSKRKIMECVSSLWSKPCVGSRWEPREQALLGIRVTKRVLWNQKPEWGQREVPRQEDRSQVCGKRKFTWELRYANLSYNCKSDKEIPPRCMWRHLWGQTENQLFTSLPGNIQEQCRESYKILKGDWKDVFPMKVLNVCYRFIYKFNVIPVKIHGVLFGIWWNLNYLEEWSLQNS